MFIEKLKKIADTLISLGFVKHYTIADLDTVQVDGVTMRRVLIDGEDVNLTDTKGNYFYIRYAGPMRPTGGSNISRRFRRSFRLVGVFNCDNGCAKPNMEALVFNVIDKLENAAPLSVTEADHYAPNVYKQETGHSLLQNLNAFYIDFTFSTSVLCKCNYDVCGCD